MVSDRPSMAAHSLDLREVMSHSLRVILVQWPCFYLLPLSAAFLLGRGQRSTEKNGMHHQSRTAAILAS